MNYESVVWLFGLVFICEIVFLCFFPWSVGEESNIITPKELNKRLLEGTRYSSDFSKIERRLLSGQHCMIHDIHTERAALHFNIPYHQVSSSQRRKGKQLNFLDLYGKEGKFKNMVVKGSITGRIVKDEIPSQDIKRRVKDGD